MSYSASSRRYPSWRRYGKSWPSYVPSWDHGKRRGWASSRQHRAEPEQLVPQSRSARNARAMSGYRAAMDRRTFLITTGAVVVVALGAEAQQTAPVRRVGILGNVPLSDPGSGYL